MRSWLERWWPRHAAEAAQAVERWLVLDVETTGLDVHRDQLLAIAAVGVRVDWAARRITLQPADSLAVTLRPTKVSDKANILVHGIGVGAQRQGMDPAQALRAFDEWARGARLLAYHASFDRTLLQRYAREHLGRPLDHEWLDIAHLCTVAYPQVQARALDDWRAPSATECPARDDATVAVMAECDLLHRIWPQVGRECGSWRALQRYAGRHAWLGPR